MEWQQILGFYHVAKLKSFTRAAEATFRTQSALSQQIKALEAELGCELFERVGKRKLSLTPAGERFRRFAESVLEGYEELKEDLSGARGVQGGPLKIAAPFTTLYHLFPEKIKEYADGFPQVELTLLDRPQGGVVELVRDGEVDFGLVLESTVPDDLAAVRWLRVETVLMVPEDHPLVRLERVTWEDLVRYPLILPPGNARYAGRMRIEEELRKLGLAHRVVMESSNVELSSVYVEIGLGISFATVVKDLPVLNQKKLKFIPLDHYFEPDHICIVTRKNKVLAPYKKAFLQSLCGSQATPWPSLADEK
jgi:DNA-binding transcriptional LysR family regulator